MNELNGSWWFCVQRPRLFCKPEITLETHSDLGGSDGKSLGTNESTVI